MHFSLVLLLSAFVCTLPPRIAAQSTAPDQDAGGKLAPGDVLKIQIWREEDLSGDFLMDESGMITLPMLGPKQVTEIPLPELRQALLTEYRAQLRNPSITITPLRRVYVLGEVQQPGLYAVDPTISLAGAVALAGGASPAGDLRRLRVIRAGEVVIQGVSTESALTSINVLSGDQIFVGRRSWFDRNSTFVVSVLLSLTSIVITMVR